MLRRRTFLSAVGGAGLAAASVVVASSAWAQRPAHPIARPPGRRPIVPLGPGRFDQGGVASGALPGIYVVVEVDTKESALRLRDEGGRTGLVYVNEDMFDLATLKAGDEVEVDFMVPDPGSNRLEAGGIWKVQR